MKSSSVTLARIKTDLSNLIAGAPVLAHANGAGRIFELYLVMRLARKLKAANWIVDPLDHQGNKIVGGASYVQRGGAPTGILPSIVSMGPSSIRIQRDKSSQAYEIFNGIQFMGRSKALHEIDISLVPVDIAVALRAGTIEGYPVGRPCLGVECKDVGSNGTSDEMRSVIARMYDLTFLDVHRKYVFGGKLPSGSIFSGAPSGPWAAHGTSATTFLHENQRSLCALVRRTGITAGAYKMTGLFHVRTYIDVDRGTQGAKDFIDDTIAWMTINL